MWTKKRKPDEKKELDKKNKIDEEIFKNLPPGVKIKKIEIEIIPLPEIIKDIVSLMRKLIMK